MGFWSWHYPPLWDKFDRTGSASKDCVHPRVRQDPLFFYFGKNDFFFLYFAMVGMFFASGDFLLTDERGWINFTKICCNDVDSLWEQIRESCVFELHINSNQYICTYIALYADEDPEIAPHPLKYEWIYKKSGVYGNLIYDPIRNVFVPNY